MVRLILAGALLALASCTTTGGNFCDVSRPIRPSAAEITTLSDARVADILAHNKRGAALCGWKP